MPFSLFSKHNKKQTKITNMNEKNSQVQIQETIRMYFFCSSMNLDMNKQINWQ